MVGEILPDAGDDTRNNARRHALWSALYWLQSGDTVGPDAHENIVDGQLDGYLNDQRLMDLINNEVGFEIAQGLEASGLLPGLMPAAEMDPFLYTLDSSAVLGAPGVREFLLAATEQAANDGRLVWLQ